MTNITDATVRNGDHITLWGPPSSGKTWMLEALKKAVAIRNANDSEFFYQLLGFDDEESLDYDLPPKEDKRNGDGTTHRWRFIRRPRKSNNDSVFISAHTHYLYINDLEGGSAFAFTDAIKNVIKKSKLIVVFLDVEYGMYTTSSSKPKEEQDYSSSEEEPNLFEFFRDEPVEMSVSTPKEPSHLVDYDVAIETLFTYLESLNNKPYVAVCLSKVDAISKKNEDIQGFIKNKFGHKVSARISSYTKNHIEYFKISSTGFLSGDLETSNFNPETNTLLDKNQWVPKVELPFYWFFDQVKLAALSKTQGVIHSLLFHDFNLEHYIKYPDKY